MFVVMFNSVLVTVYLIDLEPVAHYIFNVAHLLRGLSRQRLKYGEMDPISSLKRGKGRYIIHVKLAGQLSE
jgi:hypothetical protein